MFIPESQYRGENMFRMSLVAAAFAALLVGYAYSNQDKPDACPEQERKAGERMALTIKGVEYAFRWCPAGTFMMGSPASEEGRYDNESQHHVTLSRGFWLLETEVTQKMWKGMMENNPSSFKGDKLPVEKVSWNDCQEYIKKLNDLGAVPKGFRLSLPTEAQWEYACRAGTTTPFHFGDTLNKDQANFSGKLGKTSEVGSYPANAWGLHDMHGNVWEWCLDWYGDYPNGAVTDPAGATSGSSRVFRGGYWSDDAEFCRSAIRWSNEPSRWNNYLGLRVSLVCDE